MKIVRAVWWPIGWTLRTVAWVMVPPIGWALSRRRRNARRHRQLVAAASRPIVVRLPAGEYRSVAQARRSPS